MGLETATWITELVNTNPTSSDVRSQGDDHLRLLKAVLANCFPTANKAFYNPTTQAKSANFSIVLADMNKTFLVDTGAGAIAVTLPALSAGDAGWTCWLLKSNTGTNPMLISVSGGANLISGQQTISSCRRSIPGVRVPCTWNGTTWIVERVVGVPLGALVPLSANSLPVGFEWPNGQTLSSSANYPDYNSLHGTLVTLDVRGRAVIGIDNMAGAAGRLGVQITGTQGSTGGTETVTLSSSTTGAHSHGGTVTAHSHQTNSTGGVFFATGTGSVRNDIAQATVAVGNVDSAGYTTGNASPSLTTDVAGGGAAHSNLQPSICMAYALAVE